MNEWKFWLEGRCRACGGTGTVRNPKSAHVLNCGAVDCQEGIVRKPITFVELKKMLADL